MSEPTRTSAQKRAKLALALKRNMARRKAVVSNTNTNSDFIVRSGDGRREPEAGGRTRGCDSGGETPPRTKGATP